MVFSVPFSPREAGRSLHDLIKGASAALQLNLGQKLTFWDLRQIGVFCKAREDRGQCTKPAVRRQSQSPQRAERSRAPPRPCSHRPAREGEVEAGLGARAAESLGPLSGEHSLKRSAKHRTPALQEHTVVIIIVVVTIIS